MWVPISTLVPNVELTLTHHSNVHVVSTAAIKVIQPLTVIIHTLSVTNKCPALFPLPTNMDPDNRSVPTSGVTRPTMTMGEPTMMLTGKPKTVETKHLEVLT